ncbi:MAG: YgfZ/GcvT domain-containing protein [Steroidobacteraceae bacterium]
MERSGNPQGPADIVRDPVARLEDGVELDDLGVLRVRETDAERFLQGQLSNDVTRLAREGSLLAGFHNPQGRAIALLRLVHAGEHDVLILLPRELAQPVAERLSRFILRSKVRITEESSAWRVRGFAGQGSPEGLAFKVSGEPPRWISIVPAGPAPADEPRRGGAAAPGSTAPSPPARNIWRLLDIAAGLPQVHLQTSELFVAQMLNLDVIDAIAFSKGCYTGQEVIARAHYRGRVKRRMQRWRTAAPAALAPGQSARLTDGRTLRVVEAAQRSDGRSEFLAVAPLAAGADDESQTSHDKALLEAEPLPLPYELGS